MAAYVATHGRNDSGVSVHSYATTHLVNPPSPTLTNPDMITPISPWRRQPSHASESSEPLPQPEREVIPGIPASTSYSDLRRVATHGSTTSSTDTIRYSFDPYRTDDNLSTADVGIATAISLPSPVRVNRFLSPVPVNIVNQAPSNPPTVPLPLDPPSYAGYEHGTALSDIYEESEASTTPKRSLAPKRYSQNSTISQANLTDSVVHPSLSDSRSATPTERSTTTNKPPLRHKKRESNLSTSSGGSETSDWENFDSKKLLSNRAANDLANMKTNSLLEPEDADSPAASKRASREEQELAAINARAEQILDKARKRLTHMEDNLRSARTSVLLSSRSSPHMNGEAQPVGSLYRSISAAGATRTKLRPLQLPIRTGNGLVHSRVASDTGAMGPVRRMSVKSTERSASALEYASPARYHLFPDGAGTTNGSLSAGSSPATRAPRSPLLPHKGSHEPLNAVSEEAASPASTTGTPEMQRFVPRAFGLGIHNAAARSTEQLATSVPVRASSTRIGSTKTPVNPVPKSPPSTRDNVLVRSGSAASTRSMKDLKDQMADLKSRMNELKMKTQTESLKRQSMQSLRSSSGYQQGSLYSSSPVHARNLSLSSLRNNVTEAQRSRSGTPVSQVHSPQPLEHDTTQSSSPTLPTFHSQATRMSLLPDDFISSQGPTTPFKDRSADAEDAARETDLLNSAHTDRNTPNLSRPYHPSRGHARKDSLLSPETEIASNPSQGSVIHDPEAQDVDPPVNDVAVLADHDDDDNAAENEEEQIYLNEVLEESLREAEIPPIPQEYLAQVVSREDLAALDEDPDLVIDNAFLAHEDRLDAFDYENMFLHSALGNYTGRPATPGTDNGSDSDQDTEREFDDDGSESTQRAGQKTPGPELASEDVGELDHVAENGMPRVHEKNGSSNEASKGVGLPNGSQLVSSPPAHHNRSLNGGNHLRSREAHTRTFSGDSISTAATFETATENAQDDYDDEYDDEHENSILAWAGTSTTQPSSTGYNTANPARTKPSYVETQRFSPNRGSGRHGFSSPLNGGRSIVYTPAHTPSNSVGIANHRRIPSSPLRQQFIPAEQALQRSPGLGLGVVGGENAQYINDNGVPQRFQAQHARGQSTVSTTTLTIPEKDGRDSRATVIQVSPGKGHARSKSSGSSFGRPRTPVTVNSSVASTRNKTDASSPTVVSMASSPQRKVVINRSLQRPQSCQTEQGHISPPIASTPLPQIPTNTQASSKALQKQIAGASSMTTSTQPQLPSEQQTVSANSHGRPFPLRQQSSDLRNYSTSSFEQQRWEPARRVKSANSVRSIQPSRDQPHSFQFDTSSQNPVPLPQATSLASKDLSSVALIESLIKINDPTFTVPSSISFPETHSDSILTLLGVIGHVCKSTLSAQELLAANRNKASPEIGGKLVARVDIEGAEARLGELKRRLDEAVRVLGRGQG